MVGERQISFPVGQSNGDLPRENRERKHYGIKFFSGTALPNHETMIRQVLQINPNQLREDRKVWRPEETLEAAVPFFTNRRVNIIGDPQSGKGTILFGLSEICDIYEWGYVFIDGHHQDAPEEYVVDVINTANQRRIPIFFDSFDYLFVRGKLRAIPINKQEERTRKIIDALNHATVPIAITSHDEEWALQFLNIDFRTQFQEELKKYPSYEIPLNFRSKESIRRFLLDQGMPAAHVEFILGLEGNHYVIDTLTQFFGDKQKVSEIFEALLNYPVLKELVRDGREEFFIAVSQAIAGDQNGIKSVAVIIREAEYKRVFLTTLRKTR